MRRIKSIFFIFVLFLVMITASFLILYRYSARNLQFSLMSVAKMQMEYSSVLLKQKIKEMEIEADGILGSDDLNSLQKVLEEKYDAYNYVMAVKSVKEFMRRRQNSNVGMAEFILFWPDGYDTVTSLNKTDLDQNILGMAQEDVWFEYKGGIYYVKQYAPEWGTTGNKPYLYIKMDRDYLYKIKNMASGMNMGGTLMTLASGKSLFPVSDVEEQILAEALLRDGEDLEYEVSLRQGSYQIIKSGELENGLELITYYPIEEMMQPVRSIMQITGGLLAAILLIGLFFLLLYYKNILLQLRIITEKLRQVENGDLSTRITQLPDNEFSYVFEQFNRMVTRTEVLLSTSLKEQQLRSQAEMRQLQLQIHPHFLYNSLSYIVTVAEQPEAVTQMAVHLADYYRYCTRKKLITTIGEEVSYAKAYLSIMAMRKRIEYSVNAPENLLGIQIIPLILQPVIENAIEHAIEERENAKHIYVKIYELPNKSIRFEISDDGDGMNPDEIERLAGRLKKKRREEEETVGLWNVQQRLTNFYDETAGLKFSKSIWGGLMVSFTLPDRPLG